MFKKLKNIYIITAIDENIANYVNFYKNIANNYRKYITILM